MGRRKVIFISGPMTGYEDYNRAAFNAAAKELVNQGYTVLNAAVLPDGLEHEQYMQICLAMLQQADAIYILAGWENSVGARREVEHASALGIDMEFQCWGGLSACIAGIHSDGRRFMKTGVQAMHDYLEYFLESHGSSMNTADVRYYRFSVEQCKNFIEVLDGIGVADGESH
ncbi:DUF4406 domain-containing protein [Trabulsiella odontotermitis]|uniref:DUF4406 domain-containing protein n=1 Tax=Trabulsiella odontotermitis TaxID=379893 RepID=UPI001EDFF944|nr:DUF4406 domain-containing protein [Trabulsiella odontotermitis]